MSTTLLDAETREPLFQQGEPYTLRQFIKIAKKSAEGKKAYKGDYNFGKGIKLAEYLRANIPHIAKSMKATVYRSAWNYGENLVVTIGLGGKSYNQRIFSFNSGDATRQPTYSFATMFNGTIKPSNPGKPVSEFGMGTIHGSYQSISQFDKFMSDIVGIFNDFERLHGKPFDVKTALAEFKAQDKIRAEWAKRVAEKFALKESDVAKIWTSDDEYRTDERTRDIWKGQVARGANQTPTVYINGVKLDKYPQTADNWMDLLKAVYDMQFHRLDQTTDFLQ